MNGRTIYKRLWKRMNRRTGVSVITLSIPASLLPLRPPDPGVWTPDEYFHGWWKADIVDENNYTLVVLTDAGVAHPGPFAFRVQDGNRKEDVEIPHDLLITYQRLADWPVEFQRGLNRIGGRYSWLFHSIFVDQIDFYEGKERVTCELSVDGMFLRGFSAALRGLLDHAKKENLGIRVRFP